MRTILPVIAFLLLSVSSLAQRNCATTQYTELQRSSDPRFSLRQQALEDFIRSRKSLREEDVVATVIRIPVVVHVLYKTAAQNISDEQIKTQIDALNRDFRKRNADTSILPASFAALAADIQIEFALATADPAGRATTGILRKQTSRNFWDQDDRIKFSSQGGDDAWDSHSYLNIWVGNMIGVLGYASTPGSDPAKDGLVLNYTACGTINTSAPYQLGRTGVHEIGHWLGLKHIWGDSFCGDDGVDDTPRQGNFTSGCPSGFRSSCSNGATGDMYQNYMDYTNDACMVLFTRGQKQRMLALFSDGGPRSSLLQSRGLNAPWNTEPVVEPRPVSDQAMTVYPNPAANELTLHFTDVKWIGQNLGIYTSNGILLKQVHITAQNQKLSLTGLPAGLYFMETTLGEDRVRGKFVKL